MGDNPVHTADSKSLWNYTLSPGWTDKEIEVFVAAIQKYGVGRWTKITKERVAAQPTVHRRRAFYVLPTRRECEARQ